jgi:hypothetical protein
VPDLLAPALADGGHWAAGAVYNWAAGAVYNWAAGAVYNSCDEQSAAAAAAEKLRTELGAPPAQVMHGAQGRGDAQEERRRGTEAPQHRHERMARTDK